MATTETEVGGQATTGTVPVVKTRPKREESALDKALGMLSSVRFGIVMLSMVLMCCMIGMLIMQQDVQGFREYYQRLTPAQQFIYGRLGVFDIYHSWYFSLLLAITGLNIILASIDRFPTAWQYIAQPKLKASPNFIRAQMFSREESKAERPTEVADRVRSAWRRLGFRARVSEENGRLTVFAQRNVWNRLGAYVVHVALLTIFTGGFITNRYRVGGLMELTPGQTSEKFQSVKVELDGDKVIPGSVPFKVECVDIQQQLIRPEGGLDAGNTVDWRTYIKIKDGAREESALVHLNEPYDYRGYRFFQSFFSPRGYARQITVSLVPAAGGQPREFTVPRDATTDVEGIGRVSFVNFYSDFTFEGGRPTTETGEYNNPVAELQIVNPEGRAQVAFAFGPEAASQYYSSSRKDDFLVAGNQVLLKGFEKVATSHTLEVQYDPGRIPVYTGFTLLVVALCGVFFFSHQRVWAVIEPGENGGSKVHFGGNTNRNRPAFEGRFNTLVESAK